MNDALTAVWHAQRAAVLYSIRRYRAAERHARAALAAEPDDADLRSLLSLCLNGQGKRVEARSVATEAIQLAPDDADQHKVMAVLLLSDGQLTAAAAATRTVLALAPTDAYAYALLGGILAQQADWLGAIDAAEQGLALDPDMLACMQLRALALASLGHATQAESMLRDALARDPESAETHAIRGHVQLRSGDFAPAGEHFREALRLDPHAEPVRMALIEMLKARNPIYAAVLRVQLWLSRFSRITRTILFVLAVATTRHVVLAHTTGPDSLAGLDAIVLVWVFVGLAPVVFTLTLLSDRFGRQVLRPDEIWSAVAVSAGLVAATAALVIGTLTENIAFLFAAPGLTFCSAAAVAAAAIQSGRRRRVAVGGSLVVGGLMAVATVFGAVSPAPSRALGLALPGVAAITALLWLVGVVLLARIRSRLSPSRVVA
jgi:Flp pilus assembly protein TadD